MGSFGNVASRAGKSSGFYAFVVAFLVAALAVLLLAGCGTSSTASNSPPPPSTPPPSTPPPPQPPPQVTCPTVQFATNQGPTKGTAPFPPAATVPPPTPGTTSAGSVCVSEPANNATVSSPVHMVAVPTTKNPLAYTRVYLDGQPIQFSYFNQLDSNLWMDPGVHNVEVLATDNMGNNVSTSFTVNVVPPQAPGMNGIQNLPNWEPCSAQFPPGHPRAGQICAAGLGDAFSTMTENQMTPSMSGSSAKMALTGGTHAYSNELYTKFLGGGMNVSKFTYDLYFMIDQPDRAQALEFDVNQAFNNQRWVYGTECNFKGDGVWDVWDAVSGWTATKVPCKAFPANQWIHLVWQFERVGTQVHYISVTIDGQAYPVEQYQHNESVWPMESIDVAFQMDGDYAQEPYNVWLDNVTLYAQ